MPGLTQSGCLYALPMPARPMEGFGGSLSDGDDEEAWATPSVCGNHNRIGAGDGRHPRIKVDRISRCPENPGGWRGDLKDMVLPWATPASRDFRHPNATRYKERGGGSKGEQLPNQVQGALNPEWVEILMGWPLGWTDPSQSCPGIWPGWPMGMGPDQHPYEPPRTCPKGRTPHRVPRIKACGNGVVPVQAEMAFTLLIALAVSLG